MAIVADWSKVHVKEKEPDMLAKEKWQIKTIAVLERVFEERQRQVARYGHNEDLEDGTGPGEQWLTPLNANTADEIQRWFRKDYETKGLCDSGCGPVGHVTGCAMAGKEPLTWMHLVREEIAEAFELSGDDPRFVDEILQVAALCVSWAEKKVNSRGETL